MLNRHHESQEEYYLYTVLIKYLYRIVYINYNFFLASFVKDINVSLVKWVEVRKDKTINLLLVLIYTLEVKFLKVGTKNCWWL